MWVGPEATAFEEVCEVCVSAGAAVTDAEFVVHGTLRSDADVGFTTCSRGHRIVVRRVGRPLARLG